MRAELRAFRPEMTVVTTAPTYLFWRCAPPELRVPQADRGGHSGCRRRARGGRSARLGDAGCRARASSASTSSSWASARRPSRGSQMARGRSCQASACGMASGVRINGGPQAAAFVDTPPLFWPDELIRRHRAAPPPVRSPAARSGRGGRGVPRLPVPLLLLRQGAVSATATAVARLDALLAEIDASDRARRRSTSTSSTRSSCPIGRCSRRWSARDLVFGVQTRIDLWKPEMIELLGRAGCVSIEAGVESLTPEGRDALDKDCRMGTEELTERLVLAKRCVPFVQANLIETPLDDPATGRAVARGDARRTGSGPTTRCPCFRIRARPTTASFGACPDDRAWERAHEYYLAQFRDFSEHPGRAAPADRRAGGESGLMLARISSPPRPGAHDRRCGRGRLDATRWSWRAVWRARVPRWCWRSWGRQPAPEQLAEAAAIHGVQVVQGSFDLEWMPGADDDVAARRRVADGAGGDVRARPRAPATAMRMRLCRWRAPVVVVAHSCVLSWWRAVHGEEAPAEWDGYRRRTAAGLRAADLVVAPTRAFLRTHRRVSMAPDYPPG